MMRLTFPKLPPSRNRLARLLAVAALYFGLTSAAQAEIWQLIGAHTDSRYYVDKESLVSAVRAVEYWDKLEFATPQSIGAGRTVKEIRSLSIADCAARTIAGEYYAVYGAQGKLLDVQAAPRIFRATGQGTTAAATLDFVCRAKPNPASLAQRKGGAAALLALLQPSATIAKQLPSKWTAFTHLITREATAEHVDPALVKAVIAAESGFNPYAVSPKGAIGLMQLIPATAQRFGVTQLFDPEQNIKAGVKYLKYLLGIFHQNLNLAVAAYNAGEQAIMKYGGQVPPYPETRRYVPKVITYYNRYKE